MKKLIVVGASLALLLAPVAPASATPTLPAGDALYEMTCQAPGAFSVNDYQLLSINTSDNTRTLVGAGTGASSIAECGYQGAMLPGTSWFYFVDYNNGNRLVRSDVTTGVPEVIGDLREVGGYQGIYSLAIDDDGNAYALSYDTLFSVDLSTGNLTEVVYADTYALDDGYPYGFAYDPKTDKFYMAESGAGGLYTLNIATGEFTHVATNPAFFVGSMAFDSSGKLWMNGDSNVVSRVAIGDFDDYSKVLDSGSLTPNVYSESLVIVRGPGGGDDDEEGLAKTGSADATPYLLGGLLAAGIALVLRRRRV